LTINSLKNLFLAKINQQDIFMSDNEVINKNPIQNLFQENESCKDGKCKKRMKSSDYAKNKNEKQSAPDDEDQNAMSVLSPNELLYDNELLSSNKQYKL
jgi:hypothetical protein